MSRDSIAIPRATAALLFGLLQWTASATDFHVAKMGRDSDDGLSPKTAWRTLDRVNRHLREHGLKPGDRVCLRGGDTFEGGLTLSDAGGGTESAPVVVCGTGKRPARILAGKGTGILVRETPWVVVSNLVLQGRLDGDGDGIRFDRLRPSGGPVSGAVVSDCRITGFAWHGVMVDASQREHGYSQVRILRVHAASSRHAGIQVYGGNPGGRTRRPHADVLIEDCTAFDNPGDPDLVKHHSGSGIFVDGAEGVQVRRCVAAGNGTECRSERGGPVGIWLHACRGGLIEHCESFGNRSALRDGGGFDLDGGCEDCVLRHNYSHDNDGPGLMVYSYSGAPYADRGCVMDHNISIHDGRRGSGYAGLQLGGEEGCRIRDLLVTNNTVIAPEGAVTAFRVLGHGVEGVVRGNRILASPHAALLSLSGYGHRLRFEENHWWRNDGHPVFVVDFQWPVTELARWRNSAGPETRFEVHAEIFADPGLKPLRGKRLKTSRPTAASWPILEFERSGPQGSRLSGPGTE